MDDHSHGLIRYNVTSTWKDRIHEVFFSSVEIRNPNFSNTSRKLRIFKLNRLPRSLLYHTGDTLRVV